MSDNAHLLELDKAVHFALSRMLGAQTGSRSFNRTVGEVLPALSGDAAVVRTPKRVMRRLGLTPADLDDRWVVARANGNLLPRELVEEFFVPAEWRHVAAFIALGPLAGWEKVEALLTCWSRGLNSDGTPRRKPLSAATVEFHIGGVFRLMRELCEPRKLAAGGQIDLDPTVLSAWELHQLPKRMTAAKLGARPANSDRRAPSLRAIRLALRALHRDVEARRKNRHQRPYMYSALRNRALLATFVTVGGRLGAISALRAGDFVRFHKSQGHEGPALMLRPGKGLHSDLVRVKFLPRELGEWLHEWIEYAGLADKPEASLWSKGFLDNDSLTEEAIRALITRLLADYVPGRSCSPHTLRHLCEKLVFLAGMDWLDGNREQLIRGELSGLPSSPQTFADALLDHALGAVQDTYKDISSERGRETWARIAAEGVWDLVWGDKGAPKGPDPERVAAAQAEITRADLELRRAKDELTRLEAKKKVVRQQAIDRAGLVDGGETLRAMLELDALADEVAAAIGAVAQAERQLDLASQALKEAKAVLVPLSDEDPGPAGDADADVVVPTLCGAGDDEDDGVGVVEEPYRRDRITPREFQWALGGADVVADSTLRRWVSGQLPHRRGDRRNAWDPPLRPGDLPGCIHRPSPRKTWILLDRLDWSRYPVAVIDRLTYLQTLGEEEVFTMSLMPDLPKPGVVLARLGRGHRD